MLLHIDWEGNMQPGEIINLRVTELTQNRLKEVELIINLLQHN